MPRQRQTGDGGLYFDKKRNIWIGVIDIPSDDGRRKQKRVSSKSQSVAREKLKIIIAEKAQLGTPRSNQTVAAWGSLWLEGECKAKLKPGPLRAYKSIFNTWIEPSIGKMDLRDVRPSDLTRIYEKARKAGKSDATRVKIHTVVSSMFESARYERLVPFNVAKETRTPKITKSDTPQRGALSVAQMRAALLAAENVRHGTKWAVSLYAGLRQGERLGATIDSLDFANNTFTVRWSLTKANFEHGCGGACGRQRAANCPDREMVIADGLEWRPLADTSILVRPKSGEERTFHMPAGLATMLERHILELAETDNPHGLLWPAANGKPMDDKADQKEWRQLLTDAEIDLATSTHWARHTAVSSMTEMGVSDKTIGEIVGHKSPGVTGRYQHISSAAVVEAMEKLTGQIVSSSAASPERQDLA